MRILVVGAGAIRGYFVGRLLEADQSVTFLGPRRRTRFESHLSDQIVQEMWQKWVFLSAPVRPGG
jgi:hypothetical protein